MDAQLKPLTDAIAATNKFKPIAAWAAKLVNDDPDDFRIRDVAEFRCEALNASTAESDFRKMVGYVLSQYMKSGLMFEVDLWVGKQYVGNQNDPRDLEEYIMFRFVPFNIHDDGKKRVAEIESMIASTAKWVTAAFA